MTEPLKIGVLGALGRMGRTIIRLALEPDSGFQVVQVWDRDASGFHPDLPGLPVSAPDRGLTDGERPEVLVDFSLPQGTMDALSSLVEPWAIPLVSGTTGFSQDQHQRLREVASRVPMLVSPNMSQGVSILRQLTRTLAPFLAKAPEFDVELVEMHHSRKKDAPSGTALALLQDLGPARDLVHGRSGDVGERPRGQIGVHAVRGGDVVGEHTIILAGPGERIELTHKAWSREIFARGALKAAAWLPGRAPGFYTMEHIFSGS